MTLQWVVYGPNGQPVDPSMISTDDVNASGYSVHGIHVMVPFLGPGKDPAQGTYAVRLLCEQYTSWRAPLPATIEYLHNDAKFVISGSSAKPAVQVTSNDQPIGLADASSNGVNCPAGTKQVFISSAPGGGVGDATLNPNGSWSGTTAIVGKAGSVQYISAFCQGGDGQNLFEYGGTPVTR